MFLHEQSFSIFATSQALMGYFSAWNTVVWNPRLNLCLRLEPHLYTLLSVPLLTSDGSVYKAGPPLISSLNLFCHSPWYEYFGTKLPVPSVNWVHALCPEIVQHDQNLLIHNYTAGCILFCTSLPGPPPQSSREEGGVQEGPFAAVGALLVEERQANNCNLLSFVLKSRQLNNK